MRDGELRVGYGMATATFPGNRMGGACRIRLMADGRAIVSTSALDIDQGAYTVLAQIAADALGLAASAGPGQKCSGGRSSPSACTSSRSRSTR